MTTKTIEDTQPDSTPAAATDSAPDQQSQDRGVSLRELPELLQNAVRKAGWTSLMPVQSMAIPYLMRGRDLMVQSRTGSGKTGAFLLPILHQIDPKRKQTQALVLTPTRELAAQVSKEAERLMAGSDVHVGVVYGGVGYGPQIQALRQGAQLIVGTPGRILDHLMRGTMVLKGLSNMVFDEADRLMSMGFYPDMERLRGFLPDRRTSCMFSATYPPSVLQLAERFLNQPEHLNLSRDQIHVVDTDHVYYVTGAMDKDRGLIRLIEIENPESAIIFCNTKAQVDYVDEILRRFGYEADRISSDLTQGSREAVMGRVRQRNLRFLVATDVAARGIDIDRLSHVFLYDFPEDPESYIHRAGRTGRAGAIGVAVSLVGHAEELKLLKTAEQYKIPMEKRPMPTDEDVQRIVSERITVLAEAELRSRDSVQRERMERFVPLARSLGESDDELAVIAMLLDDFYQKSLHAPVSTWSPAQTLQSQSRPKKQRQDGESGGKRRRARRRRNR